MMRMALMTVSFLAFGAAQALAGAVLMGEVSTAMIGQYVAVIAFLAGVAGVLAKIVQSLYQKIIEDKERRIKELQAKLDALDGEGYTREGNCKK